MNQDAVSYAAKTLLNDVFLHNAEELIGQMKKVPDAWSLIRKQEKKNGIRLPWQSLSKTSQKLR
jgi:hypothetical protein